MYKTIKQRAKDEARRATRPTCICGKYIQPKDLFYYINQYNERVPICWKCLDVISKVLTDEELNWLLGVHK